MTQPDVSDTRSYCSARARSDRPNPYRREPRRQFHADRPQEQLGGAVPPRLGWQQVASADGVTLSNREGWERTRTVRRSALPIRSDWLSFRVHPNGGCSAHAGGRGQRAAFASYAYLHVCGNQLCRSGLADRISRGSPQHPAGCQPCLRSASALSPSARMMAALGAEPQLRVRRKSSGRTRRRSSISCCGSHRRSSTRAQKRAW